MVVVIMSYPAHDDANEYMQHSAIGPLIYNPLHGRYLKIRKKRLVGRMDLFV
jgi:hypothetical protein